MPKKTFLSLTDQVVDLLRQGMLEGRWRKTLPGRDRLAQELGCSHWTIEESLQRLVKEGLLVSQGAGRPRLIQLPASGIEASGLRVKVLLFEKSDRNTDYLVELIYQLQQAGHEASFAEKTMKDFDMNVDRIARFANSAEADAWVLVAGPQDVLQWFSELDAPAFALFGRLNEMPMASAVPERKDSFKELIDRLVNLGHQRIVMLAREDRRKPVPGYVERIFLEYLEVRGIQTGAYNLPDWKDTPNDLRRAIDTLYKHTPPTAIILDEPKIFFAVMQYLASMGITAPNDVSLACSDISSMFDWCSPQVTCIDWDSRPLIKRVVNWVDNVSRGKQDHRKLRSKTRLVLGETIGPVPV